MTPAAADLLLPWWVGELRPQQTAELPSLAEVLQQRLAAELGQHVHRVDARVDEIAQDEIDDPVLASKRNSRLGALLGERPEPGTFAAGQNDAQDAYAHRFLTHIVSGRRGEWQEETARARHTS